MKNVLIAEGNSSVRYDLKNLFDSYHPIIVSNIEELIYYVFYSDKVFNDIVIGDELIPTNLCFGVDEEVEFELGKLKKCKYFPVTLGEICRVLSKKAGKPEPRIIIMSTFNFYLFDKQIVPLNMSVGNYIKNHNMFFIDKISGVIHKNYREVQLQNIIKVF